MSESTSGARSGEVPTQGWDVLLKGERFAAGRMDLHGGAVVRGKVRQLAALGVRVTCEVRGEEKLTEPDEPCAVA